MADKILSIEDFGRDVLGIARGTRLDGKDADSVRAMYRTYVASAVKAAGEGFTPRYENVTNNVTGDVRRYFTTSPNSAQLVPEARENRKLVADADGLGLWVDSMSGDISPAYVSGTTNRVKLPKSSGVAAEMAAMLGGNGTDNRTDRTEVTDRTDDRPWYSRLFGGARASTPPPPPGATAVPVATPEQTPIPEQTPRPMPVLASPEASQRVLVDGMVVRQGGVTYRIVNGKPVPME